MLWFSKMAIIDSEIKYQTREKALPDKGLALVYQPVTVIIWGRLHTTKTYARKRDGLD